MPRPLRPQAENTWYHVYNRGNNQQTIFENMADRHQFLATLSEACRWHDVFLSAFCLMSNHYHLVLFTRQPNLARFMHYLDGVYTKRVNYAHKRKGQLLSERYQSKIVAVDPYFLQLVRYVHLNPVKADLVERASEYRWSSHRAYLGEAHYEWLDPGFALNLFSSDRRMATEKYNEFMQQEDLNFNSLGARHQT